MFQGNGQMSHELAFRRNRDAGAHETFLLKLPDPLGIVDVIPVVTVAVGAVDAARKLEGFIRTHHADLQRDVLRRGGGFHRLAVLVLGEMIPDISMREMPEELDPVAASAEIYEAGLVEGPV